MARPWRHGDAGHVKQRTGFRRIALTRPVSDAMAQCELTHLQRVPIDIELARTQHHAYVAALNDAGLHVIELPAASQLPDSVFVEDTAVVLAELAIATRPGAPSRRAEVAVVAQELARHRRVVRMRDPATLDGGDVLHIGRTLFVGSSGRSNAAGMEQLHDAVQPFGYDVEPVPLTGCLHLKTAVTVVKQAGSPTPAPHSTPTHPSRSHDSTLLLINPDWVDPDHFGDMCCIEVSPDEPFGANALPLGDTVVYASSFPKTAALLRDAGIDVRAVDVSELAKAEGGVTCCSIIFTA